MDIEEEQSTLERQLITKKFNDRSYVQQKQKLTKIITYLNNLRPSENLNKIKQQLQMIEDLIRFFGSPILICFQNYYQELKERNDVIERYSDQIKNIASLVKSQILNKNLEELKFFQFLGLSKKKYQISKSKQEKQFLNYIVKLSQLLREIQKKIQKGKKVIQQDNFNTINAQMGDLLERDLQRQLNSLQVNFQNYFKSKTMKMFQEIQGIFQQTNNQPNQIKQAKIKKVDNAKVEVNYNQPKNQQMVKVNIPICCRTFFYKNEVIHQAQSLRIEYKNYTFPYKSQLIDILKKTFCGFLNAEGGVIFIGIYENNQTKKRIVSGEYYDENEKEKVLKVFRRIAESIEPDIVTTQKLYNVQFVPIKKNTKPYQYISGCYIIKITIRFGIRDDIYSYYTEDGLQLYSFRTENEVIHRKGREVLNALRQRIKNPLPIPQKIHEGNCPPPQIGKQIHYGQKYSVYQNQNQKKLNYKEKQVKVQIKNQFKPDECLYIAEKLSESHLKLLLKKQLDILNNQIKTQNMSHSTLFNFFNQETLKKFKEAIQKLRQQGRTTKFSQVTCTLKVKDIKIAKQSISNKKMQFKNPNGQDKFIFQNKHQSAEIYLTLNQMGYQTQFI